MENENQIEISNISVKRSDTDFELITIKQYFKIPLNERFELTKKGHIEFIDFDGNKIPTRDGLKQLSQLIKKLKKSGDLVSFLR